MSEKAAKRERSATRDRVNMSAPLRKPASYISRDEVLAAKDGVYEDAPIDEWKKGAVIRIQGLQSNDRDAYEMSLFKLNADGSKKLTLVGARARLLSMCAVDENGAKLFTDEDIMALGSKSGATMDRLFDIAQRLSGITAAEMKRMVKNSDTGRSGASASDSQSTSSE